ncbi:RNA polymerase II transcription factor SIII subunit A-domain-containing protein [Rhodofomes roseus]|uniref:RNA polymerase II transcription factor SIII subunit A-domain-containing protein n=1 Tax=Rhodofomes roseus TaxID=34475 RepID=A0ABQ8K769_9APHY|nr:RNA polymerase II transcription factor SIII subunit A-domain-containing protein [Rhodofomes roseus]KAH9833012.1 RNA polymerase II transcription factor SIII subunit A-domain-containing protein [Rhodofomes roseus]
MQSERPTGRIPTLVQLCQRVASNHVDSIYTVSGMRYDLVEPILENCSAETLLRLEHTSPDIEPETGELWKGLCLRTSMRAAQKSDTYQGPEPESWRDQYFALQEMEAQRFEELKSRLRTIRREADDRKKETQIKLTDRLPPAKRGRPWGAAYQPKTLLQRTRSEAVRMQQGIYGTPMIPMKAKSSRAAPSVPMVKRPMGSSSSAIQSTPSGSSAPPSRRTGSRVTVTTVAVRHTPASGSPPAMRDTTLPSTPASAFEMRCSPPSMSPPAACHSPLPRSVIAKTTPAKKDPTASIFMPKHRASSQLPSSRNATRT